MNVNCIYFSIERYKKNCYTVIVIYLRGIMRKFCVLLVCLIIPPMLMSACNSTPNNSIVNAQRRFAKYLPDSNTKEKNSSTGEFIDLSEGPKLKYDAKLGPSDINFDFKINTRY